MPTNGIPNFITPGRAIWAIAFSLLVSTINVAGQHTISGRVVDEQTQEPLAFVNIIINLDEHTGTTSDINGHFSYSANQDIKSLTFSYVGYETMVIHLDSATVAEPLSVKMRASTYELGEVVVKAGENPANRIIRKVIENKKINDPENVTSFTYQSYNKVIYDFDVSNTNSDFKESLDDVFQGGHVLIMESVTKRNFIRPDNSEEIILGTKVSGFKDASFAPLATDIQPFSFYHDILPILDVNYLNPISNGSLTKYDFSLKDTLFQGPDTVFILSYHPQKGKNFDGLTGLLYINTRHYAIQNVIARPADPGFIDVNLQQQYHLVDDRQWFPEQLKFELRVKASNSTDVGVKASGVSIIDSVQLNTDLRKRDFGLDAIRLDDQANQQDSIFWNHERRIPLNHKELLTYQVLDSLGVKYQFDKILKIVEKLGQNKIPLSWIDLDISKLALYNKYEGVRLGLGAYTNDQLIRHVSIGGFFGYGFKDAGWKYGGEAIFTLDKEKETRLSVRHQYELSETGKTGLNLFRPRQFDFRSWLASRMDRIQQSSVSLNLRMLRYARVNISLNNTRVDPTYIYYYTPLENDPITRYTNTDLSVHIRYAYKEKLIQSLGQRISMGTRYPVLSLSFTRGLEGVFSGQFRYNKIETRLDQSIHFRNFGESKIRIEAGYIDHPLPYGLLFTGEGSYIRNWSVLVKNSFQTAEPYEFLSDRYVSLFYSHNFGSLLLHIGRWRPTITVSQNIGWGSLSHPEYHQDIKFSTREKGLYETGLQLDNLVRFKYLGVSYMGFGAGAYMRYGPYASGHIGDDVALTFSVTFTTK